MHWRMQEARLTGAKESFASKKELSREKEEWNTRYGSKDGNRNKMTICREKEW